LKENKLEVARFIRQWISLGHLELSMIFETIYYLVWPLAKFGSFLWWMITKDYMWKIWNFTSLLLPTFYYQHCFIHKTMCFLCELWKEQDHIMQGLKYKEQKTFGKRVKKIIIWCVLLMCRAWICQHTYSRPLSNTTYHLCLQWSSSNYKTTSLLRNINKRMWKSMFTFIKSNTLKIEND
jgi:hypothetical protein